MSDFETAAREILRIAINTAKGDAVHSPDEALATEVAIEKLTQLHQQETLKEEIVLARKVLGVSSMVHKIKGVTQSMRLKLLTDEMLKIIPDTFGVIEDEQSTNLNNTRRDK